jgi:flagellar hook assembly protein FlgD
VAPAAQADTVQSRPGISASPETYNRLTAIIRLDTATWVQARVLDKEGKTIRVLADRMLPSGVQSLEWDGSLSDGRMARPGDYRMEVTADGKTLRKLVQLLAP